jgi:hypothetical protein
MAATELAPLDPYLGVRQVHSSLAETGTPFHLVAGDGRRHTFGTTPDVDTHEASGRFKAAVTSDGSALVLMTPSRVAEDKLGYPLGRERELRGMLQGVELPHAITFGMMHRTDARAWLVRFCRGSSGEAVLAHPGE